jgi:hypothetical protein
VLQQRVGDGFEGGREARPDEERDLPLEQFRSLRDLQVNIMVDSQRTRTLF